MWQSISTLSVYVGGPPARDLLFSNKYRAMGAMLVGMVEIPSQAFSRGLSSVVPTDHIGISGGNMSVDFLATTNGYSFVSSKPAHMSRIETR